uniref:Uncharacterized protein n=1 Tax=Bracon brevicornis TaxID=1563983 RepID=A0A6V7KQ45_9HYME
MKMDDQTTATAPPSESTGDLTCLFMIHPNGISSETIYPPSVSSETGAMASVTVDAKQIGVDQLVQDYPLQLTLVQAT